MYDVHTGGGGQAQVDACGWGGDSSGRPHRMTSVGSNFLSSHAKKLAFFLPEFHLWTE